MNKVLVILLCFPIIAAAQKSTAEKSPYPTNYFRNPLDIPILLAGNFGECRPGHFHSGVDIKTNGVENQAVHAAADGYISRIKMEKGGFGHALYVTHPNGYTTLYAHLNNFAPAIQKYLREKQYEKEQWNVDLSLTPSQFPVKKGQQIAWSGNTGSSTAPHLHFEIRSNKTEHPLNPELFGLPVTDNMAPVPAKLAVYNMNKSIYEQSPKLLKLHKKGNGYAPLSGDTIKTNAMNAGVGLNVDDFMNGSDNTLAFYTAAIYMDDALQCAVKLDDIGYDETRYVNAYADYSTKKKQGEWIQCFFRLPGNQLERIYTKINDKRGALAIADGKTHKMRIELKDVFSNSTTVSFYLQYDGTTLKTDSTCNVLHVNQENNFEHPNVKFLLDDKVLYDVICLKFDNNPSPNAYSDEFTIHTANVPVHKYFDLGIKPNKAIPFDTRNKIAMICSDGKDEDGRAANADDKGWYTASVRSFGNYRLVADTVAPVIKPKAKNGADLSRARGINFVIKDATTSVKSFRAELDGKWICMEQHGDDFFYNFDEYCPKGKHKMTVTATDELNNKQTLQFTFTR